MTAVTIVWENGAETTHQAARPRPGHPSDPLLLAEVTRLLTLAWTDAQIGADLNRRGVVSSWHVKDDPAYRPGDPVSYWTAKRVGNFRRKHKLKPDFVGCGYLTAAQAAGRLKVSVGQLLDWRRRGLLVGRQQNRGAQVWFLLDDDLVYRLSAQAPATLPFEGELAGKLVPLPEVEGALGVTPTGLAEGVASGQFVTWRLPHGKQFRWYVQWVASASAVLFDDAFRSVSAEAAD